MSNTSNLRLKRNLTSLVDFSRVINSSTDLDFILNNVLLTCLGKFLSTKGLIALNEKGKVKLKHSKGLSEELIEKFPEISIEGNYTTDQNLSDFMQQANLKAVEAISSSEENIGLVCLGEKLNKTDYTPDDLDFFKTILNISATAIQNSVVINELKKVNRVLDSRVQRLNSLFELSKEFGLFKESTKVVRLLMLSVIGQFLISKFAVILLDGDRINILESRYDVDELLKKLEKYKQIKIDDAVKNEKIRENFPELTSMDINLIVPMQLQGRTKGLILLGKRINDQEYTDDDIEFIYSVGSLAIISLENKRLFQEALEKQKLEEELDIARDIQRNLLPQRIPQYDNLEIAALNVSSRQVGGDYYDVIPINDTKFYVAIADVSGKGVPASLMMANIQAFLQVICRQEMKIDKATSLINDLVTSNSSEGRFITFFWGHIDTQTKTLTYVNAGHNHPLLVRDGKIKKLQSGGMILGIMKTVIPYIPEEIKLEKDDILLMYTDGISEAMNKNDEEFSEERLEKLLLSISDNSAEQILKTISQEVHKFTAGNPQSDDLTMIVLKVK
jgi:phosphoserine phosphatase RsbU/P